MDDAPPPQQQPDPSALPELPQLPELPGWEPLHAGKVRQLYARSGDGGGAGGGPGGEVGGEVLVVATDRISAYDHVLAPEVPGKGALLTALSLWWFERLEGWGLGVGSHVVGADAAAGVPAAVAGRAMVCRRLRMLPVECVARGYLAGSAWAEYAADGAVGGVELPAGLAESDRLRAPLFTPTTKAEPGLHDEAMNAPAVAALVGPQRARLLREVTLGVYERAAAVAADRGLLLADTKLELGLAPGADPADSDDPAALVVADELLTPDSSRYWPADGWAPGGPQPSVDKQYVRDWLASPASGWQRAGGEAPPPLPQEVVERTQQRYAECWTRLTGRPWRG